MESGGNQFNDVFGQNSEIIQPTQDVNIEVSESRRPSVVIGVNQDMRNLKLNTPSSVGEVCMKDQIKEEEDHVVTVVASVPMAHSSSSSKAKLMGVDEAKMRRTPSPLTHTNKITKNSTPLPHQRRFRSRSLPNIWLTSCGLTFKKKFKSGQRVHQRHQHQLTHHHHHHHHHHRKHISLITEQKFPKLNKQLLLPPVNLQSMQEIDLQEVLKNPQLRHDILFDPQIQFRPNLDGERGERKRILADNYWLMIENEISLSVFNKKLINENSPLAIMFETLRSILLSLIPSKDKNQIDEVLDIPLVIQQLNTNSFQFNLFSNWICDIFKSHCAPMRDSWVDELNDIFQNSISANGLLNIKKIIIGLRTLFSILEAMKLDVANHQIRILRPFLCSSAVSFEREYFKNATKRNKANFTSSMLWFKKKSISLHSNNLKETLTNGIVQLLSCSNMVSEFPNTLSFDQTRLIILRADLRHIICTKLCVILYKNMINQAKLPKSLISDANLLVFKREILSIILDSNGNSKWTKNLKNLAIYICSKLNKSLVQSQVDFCFNWLLNQTQPSSQVYGVLEKNLFSSIINNLLTSSQANDFLVNDELKSIMNRLKQLIDFNQNVFGDMYSSYLN